MSELCYRSGSRYQSVDHDALKSPYIFQGSSIWWTDREKTVWISHGSDHLGQMESLVASLRRDKLNLAAEVLPVFIFMLMATILRNLNRVTLVRIILVEMDQVWRPGKWAVGTRVTRSRSAIVML